MAAACRTSVLKKLCSLVHQSSPPVQSNPVQSTGPVQSTSLVQRLCTRNPAYEDLSHICLYTDMWLWLCKVSWEYCCTNIYWNLQMDGSWGKILTCCIHAINCVPYSNCVDHSRFSKVNQLHSPVMHFPMEWSCGSFWNTSSPLKKTMKW